jgi:NAD(P)-dependent dehydrogenase (short-subunit alcohol dehydrogenase family)
MMRRFAGKVVIVTGAASGIGRATALRLGGEGGAIACLDVEDQGAAGTATEIEAEGGEAIALHCDVSDPGQVSAAVTSVVGRFGPPDVLCNIAGVGRFYHSTDMTPEQWKRIIDINLTGTWLVAQACLAHMLDRGGVIVNTASTSGLSPQPYPAAYCASKGGVVMLTKALALEYLDRKLRVNAVAPGGVDTPMTAEFADMPEGVDVKRLIRYVSPRGFCQPEDQAALYAYVASDEAQHMTGSVVLLDGGLTL